jgi:hypothetical protein
VKGFLVWYAHTISGTVLLRYTNPANKSQELLKNLPFDIVLVLFDMRSGDLPSFSS